MKFQGFLNVLLLAIVLLLAGAVYLQTKTVDELRKDVSRTSKFQVVCAGREDYGRCMDQQMREYQSALRLASVRRP